MDSSLIKCCLCPFKAPSTEDLEYHILNEHAEIFSLDPSKVPKDEPGDFNTERAGDQPQSPRDPDEDGSEIGDLTDSIKILVSIESRKCEFCQFSASHRKHMRDHLLRHVSKANREKCLKDLDDQTELAKTKKRTQKCLKSDGAYRCDICDQPFAKFHYMIRHIRTVHEGQKRAQRDYSCSHCSSVYRAKENLDIHLLKVHNIDRLKDHYKCEICCKPFYTKGDLNRHLKSHEGNLQMFPCFECDLFYPSKDLLERHLEEDHGRQWPDYLRCASCDAVFCSTLNLRIHMRRHVKKATKRCRKPLGVDAIKLFFFVTDAED